MRTAVRCGVLAFAVHLCASIVFAAQSPSPADEAARLLQEARAHRAAARYADGIPLAERAAKLYETAGGPDDVRVAEALQQLGELLYFAGQYSAAVPALKRAVAIREKHSVDPLTLAASLDSLANTLRMTGQLAEAGDLFARSVSVLETARGKDDIEVARTLISYGSLQDLRGDRSNAESMLLRAQAIFETNNVTGTIEFAQLLGNLGLFYRRAGALDKARPPLERSLAIREKLFGEKSPNHPQLVNGVASLAALYQEMGEFDLAEPLHRRVLGAFEATQPNHPAVATTLTNLAMIRMLRGNHAEAEGMFQRALQIRETSLGTRHADVASTLEKMAVLYQLSARPGDALAALTRSTEILEQNLQLMLASGSEQQRLNYMTTVRENSDITLSMRAALFADDERAAAAAAALVLRRKGRVLDAMVTANERLRNQVTPADAKLLEDLAAARSQLAALVLQPGAAQLRDREARTRTLEEAIEKLEASLSARAREAEGELQPVELAAIQRSIPAGNVLVEFVKYRPFDPRVIGQANRFGPPRYAAVVIGSSGTPRWVELGAAIEIDVRISAFRAALRSPSGLEVKERSRSLADLIVAPLGSALRGASRVIFSPDGELSVIPFAALLDADGKYLIEQFEVAGVASGRDLLRLADRPASREPAVIIADPTFGAGAEFQPLPGTAQEAATLRALLADARVTTGAAATEGLIKQVRGPRLLHIATHGFFLDSAAVSTATSSDDQRGLKVASAPAESTGRFALLRSGLALAGANTRAGGANEDGLLTAFEAASLDLHGTQLVVLSACETGLGEVRSGDGVHGLRRALTLAGAETQVMSLWQVSDEATRDLMIGFYKRLMAGDGRAAALRNVQLEWLRAGARTHPFYWASFVVSGDWSPMRSTSDR
jgi:CHAT domain-containing protein